MPVLDFSRVERIGNPRIPIVNLLDQALNRHADFTSILIFYLRMRALTRNDRIKHQDKDFWGT